MYIYDTICIYYIYNLIYIYNNIYMYIWRVLESPIFHHQPTGLYGSPWVFRVLPCVRATALVLGKFLHALKQKGLHLSLDIPLLAIASTWGFLSHVDLEKIMAFFMAEVGASKCTKAFWVGDKHAAPTRCHLWKKKMFFESLLDRP